MKHILPSGFVLLLLSAGTLSVGAQEVTVNFDKHSDFTGYKTFAWTIGTPAKTPAIAQWITDGIDSRLIAKGLRKVEANANPDLIVLYHAAGSTKTKINTNNPGGYNWGRWWDGRPDEPTEPNPDFDAVELTVDIGDAKTKKLLWMANGIAYRENKQSQTASDLRNVLDKMFKKFPPSVK
jgi:Domain of unknown function (DUF4136)